MSSYKSKMATLRSALFALGLVAASGAAMAQSAVTLTAQSTNAVLPDGQSVPMWGYLCGGVSGTGVSCTALNGSTQSTSAWQPPLIRVPAGPLTITLTNSLVFAGASVPTSIVIDGQVGGGLGNAPARMPSPAHDAYGTTWPGTVGPADPTTCSDPAAAGAAGTFCPPGQADRVRSFGTEVPAGATPASTVALTWSNLRPGTYLIHSGTEPSIQHPMGLYGVLVVADPAGTAYGTAFDADVPLLFSEIDPAQNAAVAAAVATSGFSETATWAGPGACKGGVAACYPPAVNYSPRYYLINGTSFDRTNAAASTLQVAAAGATGNVLLRIVNAGQRLHVPAAVGADLTLLAEDGNKVPGGARMQSSIPMPPGKTFDATVRPAQTLAAGLYDPATLPVYDRQLSLSTNNQRDGGMQAYIALAGGAPAGGVGSSSSGVALSANNPTYYCVSGTTLSVGQASQGVLAGAVGASGVSIDPTVAANYSGNVNAGNLSLNADGTFTYTQASTATVCGGTFTYLVNGTQSHTATISECDAGSSSAAGCALGSAPVANAASFTSPVASRFVSAPPGLVASVTNAQGVALKVNAPTAVTGGTVVLNPDGSFTATPACGATFPASCTTASVVTFGYSVTNAKNQVSNTATATVNFPAGSGLTVAINDGPTGAAIANDYRWIIEEDRTFWIDPKCQVNSTDSTVRPASCAPLPVESLGYNFHSAHMPVIATGCVGTVSCEAGQTVQGVRSVCDVGNGACQPGDQKTPTSPADVVLDPTKRYFLSILPGDAINPTISGWGGTAADCGRFDPTDPNWVLYNPTDGSSGNCGHEMGGVQIAPGQTSVTVNLQQIPLPTAKISVFVFEDDNPLNGENDAGGGVDVIAPNEPGLGGFEIKLFDQAGQLGDNTGQITYDEFNQPVSNALAGYKDPITGFDACPITTRTDGLIGMIPTCPKYESDNVTPSPLAGQVVIANLYPGLYEIQAYPAADRIARGEEWIQTNTLDGGKPHEAFIIPNEPGYFQEFGPGGYHVAVGYANPAIINARKAGYCNSTVNTANGAVLPCTNTLDVQVTNNHMSRSPDQRTFDSETYDHYAFTQCYVSIGPADSEDFAFQKCSADGKVHFDGMPPGVFKMTVFDQWNDIMLDGLVGTIEIAGGTAGGASTAKTFPVTQWRTNLYTRTYIDDPLAANPGVSDDSKPGLALVNTNIRYRDGSIGFFNNTDLNGYAGFNEVFPFMNWLVVDTTQTRFKPTWTHVIYDAGGAVDGSAQSAAQADHTLGWTPSTISAANLANTDVRVKLPTDLRVPGAKYCDNADCLAGDAGGGASTGMLFPNQAFSNSIGWQGLLGQNTFIEFGVKPFLKKGQTGGLGTPAATNENGGIHGQVIYASTRPFDDPSLLLQLSWEPGIPHATVNLYRKSVDANGSEVLQLVDTTQTAGWDDWAQGFRTAADGKTLVTAASGGNIPNMNCPGQDGGSPFFATLKNSKEWLDAKDPTTHGSVHSLAYSSQFKCYDGWSQLNQAQPAPYDGYYGFPSITGIDPATGKPSATNCTACTTNPDDGNPMLPAGNYVVEVIPPTGYELVKEEDKNILMGDVYVAPVTQQFLGFGNIYIMPDQAAVGAAYNAASPGGLNLTADIGSKTFPRHEGDTGSVEAFWPCVGALRQVPDVNSEFPGASQAAPFAGAMRHLCDRKEVTVSDEASTLAKFYLFSSTHIAGHFTGTITNDFASEFDPFSPQFGEKFGPPNLPVGLRDFNGNQVARVYSDQWGIYNGLFYSTWSPNPPNPTGYAPQMSIACMNDPGPIQIGTDATTGLPITGTDPAYNPAYSNFCYEQPFMPGETTYMDTPVIPTQSFADGYNLPDTEYPDQTPAILSVTSSAVAGPWVRPATLLAPASAAISVNGINRCRTPQGTTNRCLNPSSISFPSGSVTCAPGGLAPDCSAQAANDRANAVAFTIQNNIATLMGSGYTATITQSATGPNPTAIVTVTAVTAGSAANGTPVVTATANVASPSAGLALANGTDAAAASLGLTITALGDKVVQNPNFTGPNASAAPYNQKTITRHYGFGGGGTGYSAALVAPDGVTTAALTIGSWSDMAISATVPTLGSAFNCKVQQRNAPAAQCGELVITRGDNGKHSIDTVTVTIGGSEPWVVTPTDVQAPSGKVVNDYAANFGRMNVALNAVHQSPIQVAIDSASPGDLILVTPGTATVGTYHENVIMWKPVRLQGVGAAAVAVNADAHPAGHMDQWRRQVDCVFGLSLDGIPNLGNSAAGFQGADPHNAGYSCPEAMFLTADRIPFEAITGWQATGNGNLAQVLQEPTLMGAYEGAGITVVGRGVRVPAGSPFFLGNDPAAAGGFPDGAVYLTDGTNNIGSLRRNTDDCVVHAGAVATAGGNYGTGNFRCNPSRVDGLSILNSSQGGGGLFLHGWTHNIDVANNRISANHGTLAGAINVGNGETPPVYVNDGTTCGVGLAPLCPPIPNNTPTNAAIPFGFNTFVRVHNNMLYNNASIGDALFTGTPAGAGGVTVSAGGDNYSIDHNWIAGNLSTGDGGGVQQLGVNFGGRIANNVIMFNQSTNPTLPTNGGGVVVQGANEPRTLNGAECGGATDADCPPGLGDGTGDGLVVDANLVYGNSAESGTGGGIALEMINGSEAITFPTLPGRWYGITLTNNIVANNVAGYDGAGVSLRDTLKASIVNNTVVSNDTTASAGVLFKTLGAVSASSPPPGCNATTDPTLPQDPSCLGRDAPHGPQPSGLVTMAHTQNLNDAIAGLPAVSIGNGVNRVNNVHMVCPGNYANGRTATGPAAEVDADCMKFSRPALVNDLFWQNRTFHVEIVDGTGTVVSAGNTTPTGSGLYSQQNLVALFPGLATNTTKLADQTTTGACTSGAFYWDVGLRTDDVQSGLISAAANRLVVTNSLLTGTNDIGTNDVAPSATNRTGTANPVVAQICNGARTPPEACSQLPGGRAGNPSCAGFNAPPGASETTSTGQVFVFSGIQPTATVDEGHNWLNLTYGPLTMARPTVTTPTAGEMLFAIASTGLDGAAYSIGFNSPAIGGGVATGGLDHDFFGNSRPTSGSVAIGAVERQGVAIVAVAPTSLSFSALAGTNAATQTLTVTNSGQGSFTGLTVTFGGTNAGQFSRQGGSCTGTLLANSTCTIGIRFASPTGSAGGTNYAANVAITGSVGVTGSPVALSGQTQTATFTATVAPTTLAFGNWATGQNSSALAVTVTNTGNSQLTGLNYTIGGGTPQPFTRAPGAAGGTCTGTLNAGASCTVGVRFTPTATGAVSRTLTVTGTGATITGSVVTLTGTGVAARAAVTISAPTITLPSLGTGSCLTLPLPAACSGTGLVTFTNTAAAGGSQVNTTNVAVTGGSLTTYLFNVGALAGPDGCTGVALAPGASCTVTLRFTNTGAARGTNRTGTITFTDTGAGSPQSATVTGFATP